ncbi:hypothetical protein BDQ12DRAFT_678911 [Crucibulum laeve]|uniref:Elongator complex protein 5 n=1 Tax=Crucibulum laeve TaxID=68775 RepID=A0A5C3M8C6_9AGAR|nr:hypothetical protein BDQ12DRAFT_678911 [Crucibulum laeve]
MSAFLPTVITTPRRGNPLVVLQSSAAQSSLPILRQILARSSDKSKARCYNILFSFLYLPSSILDDSSSQNIEVHDWLGRIPGYHESTLDTRNEILSAVKQAPVESINVVIDSVDTLLSNVGTTKETYRLLYDLLSIIKSRPNPSRLILHGTQPSKLIPLLTQTAFSPSIAHVIVHPTSLLAYVATEYLTPPPPASPAAKFWSVFLPISERGYDTEQVTFGARGEGSGDASEMVVEIILRGNDGSSKKRTVERVLEGWSSTEGPCPLTKLARLKGSRPSAMSPEAAPDPTKNVSFNLSLTSSQQESRANVPLPYAHEGRALENQPTPGAIFYDPDSADDIDDDDPDEDLDI